MNSTVQTMDNSSEHKKYRKMKAEYQNSHIDTLKKNVLLLNDNVVDWDSLEKLKNASNEALEVHRNLIDDKISSVTDTLKNLLKNGLESAIKSTELKVQGLDSKFLNMDAVVKTLDKKLSDLASKLTEGITKAELGFKQQNDLLSKQLETSKMQIGQLVHLVNTQKEALKKLEANVYTKDKLLQLGESFNIPNQPVVSSDQGVYKDAPLALTVCGAAVLHNIGYTDKKGHQLTLDPDTHRVLVYTGK